MSDESTDGSRDSTHSPPDFSDDVEMNDDMVSIVGSQSPPTPIQTPSRPAKLAPAPYRGLLSEARVPTPIHDNFFPGGIPGIPRSSGDVSNMDLEDSMPQTVRSPMAPPPTRRFALRDHPMPSPIREALHSPSLQSPRANLMSPTQSGAMETSIAAATQLSRLSMGGDGTEAMETDEVQKENLIANGLSPKKGRARSGAISSQKMAFSYGYRGDCDKCRARVPGHNAHYLPIGA
jgi:hypothetical protein